MHNRELLGCWTVFPKALQFCILCAAALAASQSQSADFEKDIRPFLDKHCLSCHGGEKVKGKVDFSGIQTMADAGSFNDLWESVSFVLEDHEMPPEDEPQPSDSERQVFFDWYENVFLGAVESTPGVFKPRRLSGPEYRNTLRSLFGFDLEVNVIEAEQTVSEKSLVLKLLPTDPPGASGFVNDTHTARLSTTIWSQYSYLADAGLEQYFAEDNKDLDPAATEALVRDFVTRAFRRPVSNERIAPILANLKGKTGDELTAALKLELKTVLMSPAFLYRGFLMPIDSEKDRQPVDQFELAERLSYFLWEDMPDSKLFDLAANGELRKPEVLAAQVNRLIDSPRSRTLADSFGSQWLLLEQITHERNDPPYLHALRTQPLDFIHYLFTEDRPVMELIDSKVTFTNSLIAGHYGNDRKQLKKFIKPKGVEKMAMPLQKINLVASAGERGGIMTMPGVLGMNEGPILRGTWMLRQILGEHLGEPPPDVPPIKSSPKGQNLTFRERFEQHRADKSCALCHDKIDPLGFALEGYDKHGSLITQKSTKPDTSGQLPNGRKFETFAELKAILISSEREKITRNAVEQLLAYALCRKLERADIPTVDSLTAQLVAENGTWRDLVHGITVSVPFQEMLR